MTFPSIISSPMCYYMGNFIICKLEISMEKGYKINKHTNKQHIIILIIKICTIRKTTG
jgi:hypothetical protein